MCTYQASGWKANETRDFVCFFAIGEGCFEKNTHKETKNKISFSVCVHVCMCVFMCSCVCQCLQRPEKDIEFPGAGSIIYCELLVNCLTWVLRTELWLAPSTFNC